MTAMPRDSSASPAARPRRGRPRLLALVAATAAALAVVAWGSGAVDPTALRLVWSEPYELAQNLVRGDPQVEEAIGPVTGFGLLPRGAIKVEGREGWCEIETDVYGERGQAVLEARLERRGGTWFWEWANLRLADGTLFALAAN
jgi:hypothetical protein